MTFNFYKLLLFVLKCRYETHYGCKSIQNIPIHRPLSKAYKSEILKLKKIKQL